MKINITNTYLSQDQTEAARRRGEDGSASLPEHSSKLDFSIRKTASSQATELVQRINESGSFEMEHANDLPESPSLFVSRSIKHREQVQPDSAELEPEELSAKELGNSSSTADQILNAEVAHQRLVESTSEQRQAYFEDAAKRTEKPDRDSKDFSEKQPQFDISHFSRQSRSTAILEEYLIRVREEAKRQSEKNATARLTDIEAEEAVEEHSIRTRDDLNKRAETLRMEAVDALKARAPLRQQDDEAVRAKRVQAQEDIVRDLSETDSLSTERVEKLYQERQSVEEKVLLARQQNTSVANYPEERNGSASSIDHEQYVRHLTLALIPELPNETSPDVLKKGEVVLEHLQREGVFGLSTHGRYQTAGDFAKNKNFEYEFDQRPFTEDEFLQETESAIYDVLNGGNSTAVSKSLLQAAESINSFRNHSIKSSPQSLVDSRPARPDPEPPRQSVENPQPARR